MKPSLTPAQITIRVICGIGLLLLIGEFIIHRHASFDIEAIRFFYPIFGFIAFLIVVAGGVGLRRLVIRPPDYYDDKNNIEINETKDE